MALVIYWYDFVCLAIVAGAVMGALWVLWRREGAGRPDGDGTCCRYESLLVERAVDVDGGLVGHTNTRSGHLGSSQVWMSCWRGVHPAWLVLTRGCSCIVMALFLAWDILRYDISIFVYYTEYVRRP